MAGYRIADPTSKPLSKSASANFSPNIERKEYLARCYIQDELGLR